MKQCGFSLSFSLPCVNTPTCTVIYIIHVFLETWLHIMIAFLIRFHARQTRGYRAQHMRWQGSKGTIDRRCQSMFALWGLTLQGITLIINIIHMKIKIAARPVPMIMRWSTSSERRNKEKGCNRKDRIEAQIKSYE